MPRRTVPFLPNHRYHIFNRGNHKEAIFFEVDNYRYFLLLLSRHLVQEKVSILAYCLMKNHYHLLIELRGTHDLSRMMKNFTIAYTKAINTRYGKVGHLFQGQFQGKLVDTDEYLLTLVRYIHSNPVKAQVVSSIEQWDFSSYKDYLGLRTNGIVSTNTVLEHFPSIEEFRTFTEATDQGEGELFEHRLQDFRSH